MKGSLLASVSYLSLCLIGTPAFPEDNLARVIAVMDGDTIEVMHNGKRERIRLHGIDCPEKGQAFGQRAKQAASEFVFGKEVLLQTLSEDKYGRTIADVLLLDGTNVNHELVKKGWCWWYGKYVPGDVELERLERIAREAKKGLWVAPDPVPPWVYRKARHGKALRRSALPSRGCSDEFLHVAGRANPSPTNFRRA